MVFDMVLKIYEGSKIVLLCLVVELWGESFVRDIKEGWESWRPNRKSRGPTPTFETPKIKEVEIVRTSECCCNCGRLSSNCAVYCVDMMRCSARQDAHDILEYIKTVPSNTIILSSLPRKESDE